MPQVVQQERTESQQPEQKRVASPAMHQLCAGAFNRNSHRLSKTGRQDECGLRRSLQDHLGDARKHQRGGDGIRMNSFHRQDPPIPALV